MWRGLLTLQMKVPASITLPAFFPRVVVSRNCLLVDVEHERVLLPGAGDDAHGNVVDPGEDVVWNLEEPEQRLRQSSELIARCRTDERVGDVDDRLVRSIEHPGATSDLVTPVVERSDELDTRDPVVDIAVLLCEVRPGVGRADVSGYFDLCRHVRQFIGET